MSYHNFLIYSFILLLNACSGPSLEDYREEAAGINRTLHKEMQAIHSRKELIAHTPRLKKLFSRLVDVIIAAHEFKSKNPGDAPSFTGEDKLLNESLRTEISRIYSIDGGRDLFEKAQQDALYRLDAYLQKPISH